MKIYALTLLAFSALFMSACQQDVAPTETAPVVAEPQQQTPIEPAVAEDPKFVCFLDEMNALPAVLETEVMTTDLPIIRGWLGFLSGNGTSPSNFEIVLTSAEQSFNFPALAGLARQDVADSQAKPGLVNSGYETVLSLKNVKLGKYEITMSAQLNGQTFTCVTGKFIIIK
jgi:hypothetical protein